MASHRPRPLDPGGSRSGQLPVDNIVPAQYRRPVVPQPGVPPHRPQTVLLDEREFEEFRRFKIESDKMSISKEKKKKNKSKKSKKKKDKKKRRKRTPSTSSTSSDSTSEESSSSEDEAEKMSVGSNTDRRVKAEKNASWAEQVEEEYSEKRAQTYAELSRQAHENYGGARPKMFEGSPIQQKYPESQRPATHENEIEFPPLAARGRQQISRVPEGVRPAESRPQTSRVQRPYHGVGQIQPIGEMRGRGVARG